MIKLRETSLALAVFNMLGEACGPPSYLLNFVIFFNFFLRVQVLLEVKAG